MSDNNEGISLNPNVKFKVAEEDDDYLFDDTNSLPTPQASESNRPEAPSSTLTTTPNYLEINPLQQGQRQNENTGVGCQQGIWQNEPIKQNEHDVQPNNCLFIEMAELNNGQGAWSESARWMKFEEDVEEGGRWSKPHVATVPLHSLFELRKLLLKGVVMFDVHTENFSDFVDMIITNFQDNNQLPTDCVAACRDLLLYRHTHQHERHILRSNDREDRPQLKPIQLVRSFVDMHHSKAFNGHTTKAHQAETTSDKSSKTPSSKGLSDDAKSDHLTLKPLEQTGKAVSAIPISETKHKGSFFSGLIRNDSHDVHKINSHIFKKLPPGTEATNVLIGGVDFLEQPLCAFVRFAKAQELGDLTEVSIPTKFLFILLGPEKHATYYHEVGRSISTLMSDEVFRDLSYKATSRNDLITGIDDFLEHVMVLPPGEWDPAARIDPPMHIPEKEERMNRFPVTTIPDDILSNEDNDELYRRTGRCCGGLIEDVRRKAPWFFSDIKDALSFQCLASILFMYFACLSPIVTFGGLLSKETGQNIGAIESLLAAAVCGFFFHLFAGQPLTILGSTGPVLVFESIIFKLCKKNNVDFMGFRIWIGLWVFIILMIAVLTDGCSLIRYITRFTEESFAALIGFIFIYEAFLKMSDLYRSLNLTYDFSQSNSMNCSVCIVNGTVVEHTMSEQVCANMSGKFSQCNQLMRNEGNSIFWFSVFLFSATFLLASVLKRFKSTRFLPSKIRRIVSNFSVLIVICLMVLCDYLVGLHTPKLDVPHEFRNTLPGRGWFISPFGRITWYQALLALFPAMLATILIFMDQNITSVIINRRENKLKKGGGYHLDLLIVSICVLINSLLGLPWFVAATVLSVNHVISLKVESSCTMPGENPKFIGVIEQRVTGFVVYLLIGLSVFLTTVLKYIPMPVLYGVFLFMGVSSLAEIQFWSRVLLLFMPEKYQPDYVFLRHVSTGRVHLFTIIQIICMIILWVVKSIHEISILFPIMVLALIGVRKTLSCVFSTRDLMYLDDAKPESKKRAEEDAKLEKSAILTASRHSKFGSIQTEQLLIPSPTGFDK